MYGAGRSSPDSALASDIFDKFCSAVTFKSILSLYRQLCDVLRLKPTYFPSFYPKLKVRDLGIPAVSSVRTDSGERRSAFLSLRDFALSLVFCAVSRTRTGFVLPRGDVALKNNDGVLSYLFLHCAFPRYQ